MKYRKNFEDFGSNYNKETAYINIGPNLSRDA